MSLRRRASPARPFRGSINGRPSVREEARERVRETVGALGFRRNATAFALARGVTRSVTVLTSDTPYGCAVTLQGLEGASRAAGYTLGVRVLTPEGDLDQTIASAADSGGRLVVIGFDGLGAAALDRVPAHESCAAVAEAPAWGRASGRPAVWADDREAAWAATEHLLALGHQTVHYVAIPASTGTRRPAGTLAEAGARP